MKAEFKSVGFWLCVCVFIESFCATYLLRKPQYAEAAAIIYFLSGIAICLLLLKLPQLSFSSSYKYKKVSFAAFVFITVAVAAYCYHYTKYWIGTTPLSYESADMLPVIKVMNERMLAGEVNKVYTPIPEIWGGMQPIYYPAMWLPYSIGVLANIDLRWINSFALFASFVVCLYAARKTKSLISTLFFAGSFLLLLRWIYEDVEAVHNYIRLTEEGVVTVYYVLFFLALVSRKPVLIGISLALCLLSRYSIIGLVPAAAVYLILQKQYKQLLIIAGCCAAVILLIFILPFRFDTASMLTAHPSKYIEAVPRVWQHNPEIFTNFLGFARYFVPGHAKALHYTLITAVFLFPLAFILLLHGLRKRTKMNNVLIANGKLSLVVFYCFIDVPYPYLFYTSSLVSLLLAAFVVRKGYA